MRLILPVDVLLIIHRVGVIVVGCALYGATVGLWRSPLQAVYVAVKMPLVLLLTAAGNAALNGILAQLLGTGLSFRQTSLAIVMSFAVAAIILASLSPHGQRTSNSIQG